MKYSRQPRLEVTASPTRNSLVRDSTTSPTAPPSNGLPNSNRTSRHFSLGKPWATLPPAPPPPPAPPSTGSPTKAGGTYDLPLVHAAVHIGVHRHEEVANQHLPILQRLQFGPHQGEVKRGRDPLGARRQQ